MIDMIVQIIFYIIMIGCIINTIYLAHKQSKFYYKYKDKIKDETIN